MEGIYVVTIQRVVTETLRVRAATSFEAELEVERRQVGKHHVNPRAQAIRFVSTTKE